MKIKIFQCIQECLQDNNRDIKKLLDFEDEVSTFLTFLEIQKCNIKSHDVSVAIGGVTSDGARALVIVTTCVVKYSEHWD